MRAGKRRGVSCFAAAVIVTLPLGAPAVAGAHEGSGGGRSDCHRNAPPIIRDGFPQPPARYSRNGVLETRLRASVSPVQINGERVVAMNYEGSFPGPMLVVCPGDRMVVNFENDLLEPTNLHTHGFHVSPRANHDNVYLDLEPGQRFTYEYEIPKDHPPGAYWYHPHRHMHVEPQIFGGLSGAIVVGGGLDRVRELRRVPQRWMVLQTTEVRDGRVLPVRQARRADAPLYVNGVVNPTVKIRPGQVQRWRLFNANDNRIVVLRLAGHRMWVLAKDGNTLRRPRAVRTLRIAPGSRRELLVRGGRRGRYVMKALPFAQFPGGDDPQKGGPTPNQTVLTVRSAGRPADDRVPRVRLSRPVDLRDAPVDRRRRIVFDERPIGGGITDFLLNGQMFDPNRVVTMELGKLEEWALVNNTTTWHTFHIHVNDFQVVSVGGRRRSFVDHEDNVSIPPKSTVVIRQRPTDFTGKFVFHCHVTFHEDHGMMSAVQVVRSNADAALPEPEPQHESHSHTERH
jgi:FtsP/CotA-like multicopper oxidase with cupredoxin domain